MKVNPDFASPCGLYFGVCAIYIAGRDNNQKFIFSLTYNHNIATLWRFF